MVVMFYICAVEHGSHWPWKLITYLLARRDLTHNHLAQFPCFRLVWYTDPLFTVKSCDYHQAA